jgi:hypothetical protein
MLIAHTLVSVDNSSITRSCTNVNIRAPCGKGKEVDAVSRRLQALLVVLGAVVVAAANAGAPWSI